MKKYNIGFICVHNSCRSQMAEAIANKKYSEYFNAYSAGTALKDQINQDAVKTIINLYDVDMNKTQFSKLIEDIPKLDIVITMGCNVSCPILKGEYLQDFGLDDPTGKSEEIFTLTAKLIDEKIQNLIYKINIGEIKISNLCD